MSIHPGIILDKLILKPRNISQKSFAQQMGISIKRAAGLIKGKIGITEDTDYRLSKYLFTELGFWRQLYMEYKATCDRFKLEKQS